MSLLESAVEERRLEFRMQSAGWALSCLDRLEAGPHPLAVESLAALREHRAKLIWEWHQALTQLRNLRRDPPRGPRPPAASRLAVISSNDNSDPLAPDRRIPREPTLPTWLPQAA